MNTGCAWPHLAGRVRCMATPAAHCESLACDDASKSIGRQDKDITRYFQQQAKPKSKRRTVSLSRYTSKSSLAYHLQYSNHSRRIFTGSKIKAIWPHGVLESRATTTIQSQSKILPDQDACQTAQQYRSQAANVDIIY